MVNKFNNRMLRHQQQSQVLKKNDSHPRQSHTR